MMIRKRRDYGEAEIREESEANRRGTKKMSLDSHTQRGRIDLLGIKGSLHTNTH